MEFDYNKTLQIKFWAPESAIAFQVMAQEGLPFYKREGNVHITNEPFLEKYKIGIWGNEMDDRVIHKIPSIIFNDNTEKQKALLGYIKSISEELFNSSIPDIERITDEVFLCTWKEEL